jgi:hypothetical protein
MIKKINVILTSTVLMLFITNVNSAQKDCSVFKHKVDRSICLAQNLEASNTVENSSSSSSISSSGIAEKSTGFLKKIGSTLKLKKHKKFREQGDQ